MMRIDCLGLKNSILTNGLWNTIQYLCVDSAAISRYPNPTLNIFEHLPHKKVGRFYLECHEFATQLGT